MAIFSRIGEKMRKLNHSEITASRLRREDTASAPRIPIIGLLENIRSLYNVGSIFRTSDGAFIEGLWLAGFTPHPPRPEIAKTALGATETVPWRHFTNPLDAVQEARGRGMKICLLEHTTESRLYTSILPSEFPLCLVVGNELTGIAPEVVASADCAIEIPMHGTKQSLNAAVAYGIALFELARIWTSSQK